MKKSLITAGVATAVALASVGSMGVAHAATSTSTSDPMSSLVSAIATKFNLKTADVQAVFDQQRTQMDAQRTAEVKSELAQLVKDGKLTQAQSDAIIAKRTALEQQRESNRTKMQSMTDAERKSAMDSERTALQTWLKDNGISTDYMYLLMGGPGHGGPGGPPPASTSSSSDSSSTSTNS